jgi:hypothetical protein
VRVVLSGNWGQVKDKKVEPYQSEEEKQRKEERLAKRRQREEERRAKE